jgi:hypothetical protein
MPFIRINPKAERDFKTRSVTYNKKEEQDDKLKALNNIQLLCENNNIELYYIFSPKMFNFNEAFYKRFLNLVGSKQNVFRYNNKNTIYSKKATFFDQSHLMIDGAKVFTSEISDFIKSKTE